MRKSSLMRGAVAVRADANPAELFAELQKNFAAAQAANDERIKAIEANKADPLLEEKFKKGADDVLALQAQFDALALKLEGQKTVPGNRDITDKEYYSEFDDFIRAEKVSPRLEEVKAQYSKGTDSEGGYVAPVEWDRTVIDKLKIIGDFRRLATSQQISTGALKKVVNKKGTASGWVAETSTRTATANSVLGTVSFTACELYALVNATQTILDDAQINFEDWLTSEVEEEFAYQENLAFISGNDANQPKGLLTYATGGANATTHPLGAISVIPSLDAAKVTYDGLQNLITALPTKFTPNASFIANRNCQGEIMKMKDGNSLPIWQPSLQLGQPATIRGYAVNEVSDMPDIAANALAMGFGDWARTYLIVDRVGMRILRDPYSNKPFIQFYVTKRVGGAVQNPETAKLMKIAAS